MQQAAKNLRSALWGIRGKVVHGHGRGGSQLGFPTANIELDKDTIQRLGVMENGVYFGWAAVERTDQTSTVHPMVMSVGFNPHFKDKALTVEVHFIHKFDTDFYGEKVRVLVCNWLRDQAAFTTLEALIDIIKQDCRDASDALTTEFAAMQKAHFFHEPLPENDIPQLMIPLSNKSLTSQL